MKLYFLILTIFTFKINCFDHHIFANVKKDFSNEPGFNVLIHPASKHKHRYVYYNMKKSEIRKMIPDNGSVKKAYFGENNMALWDDKNVVLICRIINDETEDEKK